MSSHSNDRFKHSVLFSHALADIENQSIIITSGLNCECSFRRKGNMIVSVLLYQPYRNGLGPYSDRKNEILIIMLFDEKSLEGKRLHIEVDNQLEKIVVSNKPIHKSIAQKLIKIARTRIPNF